MSHEGSKKEQRWDKGGAEPWVLDGVTGNQCEAGRHSAIHPFGKKLFHRCLENLETT